jgi:hypothetical protein
MSTITIIVGNVGTVLETTDTQEASDIYRHYCEASDRGDGRMARENVTMMHTVTHKDINGTERIVDDVPVLEHVGYDSRLESMDDGAFMPSNITDKQSWYEVDTDDGTDWIAVSMVGELPGLSNVGDLVSFPDDCSPENQTTIRESLGDYVRSEIINTIERIEGYGACLSAPGYTDCTDTVVCKTEHDAIVYLVETYENNG